MKHAASVDWTPIEKREPKHSKGWTYDQRLSDYTYASPYTPGKHAKPFAAHHPARPVTYDNNGATTPLNPPTNVLDAVA